MLSADGPLLMSYICVNPVLVRCSLAIQTAAPSHVPKRTNLVTQLKHIDAASSVLGKLNGGSSYTKPRHTLSAAGRRKISLAQKARRAKRASTKGQVAVKPKRTMSAEARRKIAAFQRARWAKVKAGKKAA
jgi:hypothetical protein